MILDLKKLDPRNLTDIGKKIALGFGAGFIGQVFGFLQKILLPPLYLKVWGIELYGDWVAISAIVANASILEIGGGVYLNNKLSQLYADKNIDELKRYLHTGVMLYISWPIILAIFSFLVIYTSPILDIFKLSSVSEDVARFTACVLILQVLISMPQMIFLGLFRIVGRYPTGVMYTNLILILQLLLVWLGLVVGLGMVGVSILLLLPNLILMPHIIFFINRRYPEIQVMSLNMFNFEVLKKIINPSAYFFLIQLSQIFCIQAPILLVSATLGAASVVVFSTMRTLANLIKALLALFLLAAWHDLTCLSVVGGDGLKSLFIAILRANIMVAILIFALIFHYGDVFYNFWLGGVVEYHQRIMTLFMVMTALGIFGGVYSNLLMASNRHKELAIMLALAGVSNFIAGWIGVQYAGLEGMILGMIFIEIISSIVVIPILAYRKFKIFNLTFLLKEAIPFAFLPFLLFTPMLGILIIPFLLFWAFKGIKPVFFSKSLRVKL